MKLFPSLTPDLSAWAQKQPVFFTASAPLHGAHINVSPKGLPSSHFAVLSPTQVAYVDRTGSGCETIAHSYENGRLTLMFMSFGPTPRILRLFGRSTVVEWDRPEFPGLLARIAPGKEGQELDGARAIIVCDVFEVQTSCGYGVPMVNKALYDHTLDDGEAPHFPTPSLPANADPEKGTRPDETSVFVDRPTLDRYWRDRAANNKVRAYQSANNTSSMDGLPGLRSARRDVGQWLWVTDAQIYARRVSAQRDGALFGFLVAVTLLYLAVSLGVKIT
jgi:hypothetical protein